MGGPGVGCRAPASAQGAQRGEATDVGQREGACQTGRREQGLSPPGPECPVLIAPAVVPVEADGHGGSGGRTREMPRAPSAHVWPPRRRGRPPLTPASRARVPGRDGALGCRVRGRRSSLCRTRPHSVTARTQRPRTWGERGIQQGHNKEIKS